MVLLVQENRQQRLGTACVLNCLRGKEEILRGLEVELAIFGHTGGLFTGRIFEKENDAVDWTVEKGYVRRGVFGGGAQGIQRTFAAAGTRGQELQALRIGRL